MRFRKLFDMSPAELAFRGRQAMFNAADRWSPGPLPGRTRVTLAAERQRWLLDTLGERFFPGFDADRGRTALARALEADAAADAATLLARANAVCDCRFNILGYGELSFGSPVNWHLDPVAGVESPAVHWSRLDPLAPSQVGDSKVVWELNRHQWALDLGLAYQLTDDEQYADTFFTLVEDWQDRNPVGMGVNWSSALEVAMRLIAWCWALAFFRDASARTPARIQAMLDSIQAHARFVARNLSRYFSPNTHLTVEALSLYTIGTVLPDLPEAGAWRELGREVLLEQLPEQVSPEGVYFELSTRYQYYTIEIYTHFAALAARNGDTLPSIVNERLAAMCHVLLGVRRPDGTVPQIGDTDGGWLCPLLRRDTGDYRGLFSTVALLLKDPQLAWAAENVALESLFLLGPGAADDWQDLVPAPPADDRLNVEFPGIGVVMRSDWGHEAHQLIFDTGPLGCQVSSGHGHADLLAVQCSAFGDNYLVDPGTGVYTAESPWRAHFRNTAAHSTVRVDNQDQASIDGPFAWQQRPAARLQAFECIGTTVMADATHDAYARLADPVTHRRRVWFVDKRFWLVVDDLSGTRPHHVELQFQFAPLPVAQSADGWTRASGQSSSLLLKTFSTRVLTCEQVCGNDRPTRGWYSDNYGRKVPAPMLLQGIDGDLPIRLATLLFPTRTPDSPPPAVKVHRQAGQLIGLTVDDHDVMFAAVTP